MTFTKEMQDKAKKAASAEELLAMLKAEGVRISAAESEKYYRFFHSSKKLSDEELDQVAGGKAGGDGVAQLTETLNRLVNNGVITQAEKSQLSSYVKNMDPNGFNCYLDSLASRPGSKLTSNDINALKHYAKSIIDAVKNSGS